MASCDVAAGLMRNPTTKVRKKNVRDPGTTSYRRDDIMLLVQIQGEAFQSGKITLSIRRSASFEQFRQSILLITDIHYRLQQIRHWHIQGEHQHGGRPGPMRKCQAWELDESIFVGDWVNIRKNSEPLSSVISAVRLLSSCVVCSLWYVYWQNEQRATVKRSFQPRFNISCAPSIITRV